MSHIYNRTSLVPFWVILSGKGKIGRVVNWLKEAGSLEIQWPAETFFDTVESMKNKGWRQELNGNYPFVLNPQLFGVAVVEHLKKTHPTFNPSFDIPLHKFNRTITGPADYARLFDDFLLAQAPVYVSHLFKVAERCHGESGKQYKAFFTKEPCNKQVLTRVSNNVVTIGDEGCSINLKNISPEEIENYLEKRFQELLNY